MDAYRFNDQTGQIHELNIAENAYVYMCSYVQAGVRADMNERDKNDLAGNYTNRGFDDAQDEQDAWDMCED